jgi:nodulation protein E
MKRVVVTGLGCITPIGNSVVAFRDSLYAGRTGIATIDPTFPGALSPDPGLRFHTTARVRDFDPVNNPAHHLSTGVTACTDSSAQFAIVSARHAAAESGVAQHHDPTRIAIVTGCACGGRAADEDANRHL